MEKTARRLFGELRRRRVLPIGGAYVAGAWLAAEIFGFLFDQFQAPAWAYHFLAIVLVVGFPLALVLAWTVQVDEGGSWRIDPSRGDDRTLVAAIAIGLLLTAGLSWLILTQREPPPDYEPLPASLAVVPLSLGIDPPADQTGFDTLSVALIRGLESSPDITLIRLAPIDPPADIVSFGRSLGASALATVRMITMPEGVFMRIEFHDVVAGAMTWSEPYAWDPARIMEITSAIANRLREAMQLPALPKVALLGTADPEAYAAFLRGEGLATDWTAASLRRAMSEFQYAVDRDRGFSQAHVSLARAIYDLLELQRPPLDQRTKLEARALRVVELAHELDPESPGTLTLLGYTQENRQTRIVAYERALELHPGQAMTYFRYGQQLHDDGNLEAAERVLSRAVALQPMNPRFRFALADTLEQQGRQHEAEAQRDQGMTFRH